MDPLVFEPFLRPQVWGGRRLAHFGKTLPASEDLIGESWELSGHPLHISCVACGPLAGVLLSELWSTQREAMVGSRYRGPERFPLLIKLLNCETPLSVQVHPGDAAALRLELADPGKSEAWVVLEASAVSRLDAGLREGVDRAEFERHLQAGTVDRCLNHLTPVSGDCLYLPSGTVHRARGGLVLAEIQPSSDATFRLFDWNRLDLDGQARPTHQEQGLDVIDWTLGPLGFVESATTLTLASGVTITWLLSTPQFQLNRYELRRAYASKELAGRMAAWVILDGQAELRSAGQTLNLQRGQTVLVPASAGVVEWIPTSARLSLVCVTLGPQFEASEA